MKTKTPTNVNRPRFKQWFSLSRMTAITYLCVVLAIMLTGTKFWLLSNRYAAIFDHTTYQAVTLTNGQTFFGRLDKYGLQTYVLNDVYYLKQSVANNANTNADTAVQQNVNQNTNTNTNVDENINSATTTTATTTTTDNTTTDSGLQLVRLVDDFQEPNNYLILNRQQIVFWQNLSGTSPIMKTIAEIQAQKE